jgi:hypothetical protein
MLLGFAVMTPSEVPPLLPPLELLLPPLLEPPLLPLLEPLPPLLELLPPLLLELLPPLLLELLPPLLLELLPPLLELLAPLLELLAPLLELPLLLPALEASGVSSFPRPQAARKSIEASARSCNGLVQDEYFIAMTLPKA